MNTKKRPLVVTVGNVKLPIYSTPSGSRERHTLVWKEAGKRMRKVFDDLGAAKRHANDVGVKLANGQQALLSLTAADHESYVMAQRELAEVDVPLHVAIEEFVAARKALPPNVTLTTAVEEYAARHGARKEKVTIADAVAKFIASKKSDKLDSAYVLQLEQSLTRFAGAFRTDIAAVTTADAQTWIRKQGGAPKTQNHLRADIVSLGNFARDHLKALPLGPTEFEGIKRLKVPDQEIGTLSPAQIEKLLVAARATGRDDIVLWLAIGGFSGLRPNECLRLHWSEIDLARGYISVSGGKSKTGAKRKVPISANLKAWLELYPDRKGAVFNKNTDQHAQYFARKQESPLPFDGLRHSFGTYRAAETADMARVAREMGNSPTVIVKHYDRVALPEEATAWFRIVPAA